MTADATIRTAADLQVPDELMQRLHDANQRLHDARSALEQALDDLDYRHEARVNQAGDDIRTAERALEQLSEEIHQRLPAMPPENQTSI